MASVEAALAAIPMDDASRQAALKVAQSLQSKLDDFSKTLTSDERRSLAYALRLAAEAKGIDVQGAGEPDVQGHMASPNPTAIVAVVTAGLVK